ncbi:NDR1/HIN1-like protein 6 [Quercus lobata]|uniref:Late embryogenesis abundant protein LEA-2 subgroup domain-containing protein n=1 Tax=Quercus lobata TaxID=97700 RepID=A0A7N2MQX7_QUELO|nr:NDR1/HIN1-like protein 6 [Quercus lobata]
MSIPMANHQRIHPAVGVEAPPTTPLVSRGSSLSEKGTPARPHAPIQMRTVPIPVSHANPPKNGTGCCKCICWTISLLVLLLVIVGATAVILYFVFQPKLPTYSIDNLNISRLGLNIDMSLYAEFDVKITSYNPNKKIGIYYERGSQLSVWYTNTKLCDGSLPKFYQGHQNKTVLHVPLTGQTQYGSTLMTALQQQQQTGQIPLDLKVDAPVSIKLGKLKLKKVRVLADCLLVVDSLSANNAVSIKASNCRYRMKL